MHNHSRSLRITAYGRESGAELKPAILPAASNIVNEGVFCVT